MSLRQVLTIYNAERQLNEDDVALLNTLRRMNEGEIHFLVESLSGKSQKKSSKKSASKKPSIPLCAACGYAEASIVHKDEKLSDYHPFQPPSSKSKRATELGNTIRSRTQEKVVAAATDDGDHLPCCAFSPDHNIHHLPSFEGYHEFQPAAAAAVRE